MSIRKSICVLLVAAIPLSSCATHQENGMWMGAAAGAAAGSQVGSGEGAIVATIVGALVGAIAGSIIGARLDEADRLKAEAASRKAAESGTPQRVYWSSDKPKGPSGYAEVIKDDVPPAPAVNDSPPVPVPGRKPARAEPITANDNERCRSVREVAIINGKESTNEATLCRRNGAWVRV